MAAPVPYFDDDWPGSGDRAKVSELRLKGPAAAAAAAAAGEAAPRLLLDEEDDDPDSSSCSGAAGTTRSIEELGNDFDEKLTACFPHMKPETDGVGVPISEETLLERDELWKALTSHYGRAMPVDWNQSRARFLHIPTFALEETLSKTDVPAEQSDDEELREQLDMHSIIVSCLAEEPPFSVEQVIEEIEEMMQDSPDAEARHNPSQSDLSMLSLEIPRTSSSHGCEQTARSLSVAELNERLVELEASVRRLSEELVQQLALRDELEFEKEVKNSFISTLIDVQTRQKELMKKKKKKLKAGGAEKPLGARFSVEGLTSVIQNSFRQTFGSGCSEKQYLTTVIPYEKNGLPPSVEDLQVLTKILLAMRDDSDKVPGLLTDYILKVLCPS